MSGQPPQQPRKKFLVERSIQLSVAVAVLGTVVVFTALYLVALMVLAADGSSLEDPSSRAATWLGVAVTGAYFLLVLVVVWIVIIRVTHRIAGPAVAIERAIRGMLDGDFDQRVQLRSSDKLLSLGVAVAEVQARGRSEQERREELHRRVGEALDRGQLDAVRALTLEFANGAPVGARERKAS